MLHAGQESMHGRNNRFNRLSEYRYFVSTADSDVAISHDHVKFIYAYVLPSLIVLNCCFIRASSVHDIDNLPFD